MVFLLFVGATVVFIIQGNMIAKQGNKIDSLTRQINEMWNYIHSMSGEKRRQENMESPETSESIKTQQPVPVDLPMSQSGQEKPIFAEAYASDTKTKRSRSIISKLHTLRSTRQKQTPGMAENWVGRNVLGIAASVLVFVGLIFLGVLIYEHITDEIKILLMFVISAALTGLGLGLYFKTRNPFAEILTGCGCGSFFISILLTHIHFGRLSDMVSFSILLVWMAAVLYLAKRLESLILSIVAHIGMIFSICFAYALSLSDEKLVLLLVYQMVSIAVILVGNILCCKITYRFGIFVSLILTVYASAIMWSRFQPAYIWSEDMTFFSEYIPFSNTGLPIWSISAAFIAQFVCASFLSYLLSISASRVKNASDDKNLEGTQDDKKPPYTVHHVAHLCNKLLWGVALFMNVYLLVYRLAYHAAFLADPDGNLRLTATFFAVLAGLVIVILHACLTILMSLKLNFSGQLETFSVLTMSGISFILLSVLWDSHTNYETSFPCLTFFILLGILLLLAAKICRNKAYVFGAMIFFVLDLFSMLAGGYEELTELGTIGLSIGYLFIYLVIIWGLWLRFDDENRKKYNVSARLVSYLIVEISLVMILLTSALQYRVIILLLMLTCLNILLFLVRYDGRSDSNTSIFKVMHVSGLLCVAIDAICIAFASRDAISDKLYLLLAAMAVGLAFMRIKDVLTRGKPYEEVLGGLKLTILALAIVYGNTSWLEQAYIFSLVCMLTALACIITGFLARAKYLRLYGLVLTLLCVLKLVTYDVSGLDTLMRVVTLIGGGIICFIISAIYSYSVKKLDAVEQEE